MSLIIFNAQSSPRFLSLPGTQKGQTTHTEKVETGHLYHNREICTVLPGEETGWPKGLGEQLLDLDVAVEGRKGSGVRSAHLYRDFQSLASLGGD